jgi:hypothetical protein
VDELDLRIRNHLYASFTRDAAAPTEAETAAAFGLSAEEAEAATAGCTTRTRSSCTTGRPRSGC